MISEPSTVKLLTTPTIMVELRHVFFSVGDFHILHDVSIQVPTGSATAIVGTSGAGKSTILKLVLGLIKPDSGEIYVDGEEVSHYTEEELMHVREKIGMVFQEGALFDSLTVKENVGYVLYERSGLPEEVIDRKVYELLELVELEEMIEKMPSELSGGQKRRVAIARSMAADPKIILYDEPTAGLDPITSNTIVKQIMKLRDFKNVTSIIVTHKLEDIFKLAHNSAERDGNEIKMVKDTSGQKVEQTRIFMIKEGKLIFEGNADEFQKSDDPYINEFVEVH
jgi:phospholipid/cholesterol/gamma-HCH transport system ATP-binding protein